MKRCTFTHPPDITLHLRHNVVPSSLQTTQQRASLEGPKSLFAEIDGDLDLLSLSPIRCVPSEIMMEIIRRSQKDSFRFNVFNIRKGHDTLAKCVARGEMLSKHFPFRRPTQWKCSASSLNAPVIILLIFIFRAVSRCPTRRRRKARKKRQTYLFPASNLVSLLDARPFAGDWLTPTYLAVVKSASKLLSFLLNVHPVPDLPSLVMASSIEELSASSPSFLCSLVLPSLKELDAEERVITCPMLLPSQYSLTRLCLVDASLDNNLVNAGFAIEFYEWVPEIADNYGAVMHKVDVVDGSLQHSVVPFLQTFTISDMYIIRSDHVSFINSVFVDMVSLQNF
ncbi:hypothetical protein IW262DRAFT_1398301 [Armillaria fumosa]|nr:hypothetical protein IW262DRAFT_1398301 [Armillaria fumosa]